MAKKAAEYCRCSKKKNTNIYVGSSTFIKFKALCVTLLVAYLIIIIVLVLSSTKVILKNKKTNQKS